MIKLIIGFFIGTILVSGLCANLIFANIYNSFDCEKRWKESQYTAKYDLYAGCLVSKNGTDYTPERVIREF